MKNQIMGLLLRLNFRNCIYKMIAFVRLRMRLAGVAQSISLEDYYLMDPLMSISIKFLSFMAFNVHLLSERRAFPADSSRVLTMLSSCLMNCENGISADFLLYFLIAFFRFEAFFPSARLFREFSCALHPFDMITSRHDLEREIITLTDGEKACRR